MLFKPDTALHSSPEFCKALKLVIKFQISTLLQQLADSGEESLVITANIGEGTADHLGSNKGSSFLEARDELQRQFLSYCTDSRTGTTEVCRKQHTSGSYGDEAFGSHLLSPSQLPPQLSCSPLLSPSSYHKAGPVRSRYERESSTSDSVFSPHRRKSSASSRSLDEEGLFSSADYHEKKSASELDTCFREWPTGSGSVPVDPGDKSLKYYPVKSPSCDDNNSLRVLTLSSPSEFQYRKQTKSVSRLSVNSGELVSVSSSEKVSPSPGRISNSSSSSEISDSLNPVQGQKSNTCQRSPIELYKTQVCASSVFSTPAPPTPTTPTISVEDAASSDTGQTVYKLPYEPTDLKSPYHTAETKFKYGTYESEQKYPSPYSFSEIKDRKQLGSGNYGSYSSSKGVETSVYRDEYSYNIQQHENLERKTLDTESSVFKTNTSADDDANLRDNERTIERSQEIETNLGNAGKEKGLSPDYRTYSFGLLSPLQRNFLYGGRGINRERSQSLSEVVSNTQEEQCMAHQRARFPSSSFVENLDTPLVIDDDIKTESESYEGLDLTKKRRKVSGTYQTGEEQGETTQCSETRKSDDKDSQETAGYQSGAGLDSSVKKYGKGNFIKVATGYQCRICCRVIRHMNNTTAHMRIHANLKPYKCQVCHQQFKYEVDRRYHFSKQHVDLFAKMYFPDGEKKPDPP